MIACRTSSGGAPGGEDLECEDGSVATLHQLRIESDGLDVERQAAQRGLGEHGFASRGQLLKTL